MRIPFPQPLIAIFAVLGLVLGMGNAAAQDVDVHTLEFPILLAYCERDPGNKMLPTGGRFSPEQVMEDHGCTPAEGISVTVWNDEIDFAERCETGDDGRCEVDAPTDPERELMVAIHMSTVDPGFAPVDVVNPQAHFSEFTGIGIALLAEPDATPGTGDNPDERTTIAVNVATCEDGSNAEGCEREGTEALVQASSGEITAEGEPWLLTNDDGWVSFDRAAYDGDEIDLMLRTDTRPRFACSDKDSGDRLETEWIEGREGNFIRITADTDGDITCDITLLDQQDR